MKLNLPPIEVTITPEDKEQKAARLAKEASQRKELEALGVDTKFKLDSTPHSDFLSETERKAYAKDCLLASMFIKTGANIPEELKSRLLKVKEQREALATE